MSILIKGMEMPNTCQICRAARLDRLIDCEEFDRLSIAQRMYKRSNTCPLIEVPTPHSDLIDREELLNDAGVVYTARPEEAQKIQHEINKVLFAIQVAPTVIGAEGE